VTVNVGSAVRVLVVDDSVVARRVLTEILAEGGFEVVGSAATGAIALQKIPRLRPDVVTLDLEMPDMDGLETLSAIRERHPAVRVIMVSNHTERGASATVEALFRGASDYVTKAFRATSPEAARRELKDQLLPKLQSFASISEETWPRPRQTPRPQLGRVEIVAIGASTGGPKALAELLQLLPKNLAVPVVVVQHMPENFTGYLASRLNDRCALRVAEAVDGALLAPGDVSIAPGNHHLEVRRFDGGGRLVLHQEPPVNSCRPSVDVLFHSLVRSHGGDVLAVILTGMGQDGLRGCEALRAAGGRVLAQDRATSVVWGMPGQVVTAGLAEFVAAPESLGREIIRRVAERRS
jgi:two-component system chemotaxis response regulator CheB